jgi:hypothetical protein
MRCISPKGRDLGIGKLGACETQVLCYEHPQPAAVKLVPERKLENFLKLKSKISDFKRGKMRILTTGIPIQSGFRGLELESDAEIGEIDSFPTGTKLLSGS